MTIQTHSQAEFGTETYNFIRHFEALVRRVYNDGIGVPTIGVGFTLLTRRDDGVWVERDQLDAAFQHAGITLTVNDREILNRIRGILNEPFPFTQKQQQIAEMRDDLLDGGADIDILYSGVGDDQLHGGIGDDRLLKAA